MIERRLSVAVVAGCLTLSAVFSTGCAGQKLLTSDSWSLGGKNPLSKSASTKKADPLPADYVTDLAAGRSLEQTGKHDQAREIYERLIVDYPKCYQAYHRLGVVADYQRRHREAQALYSQAIRLRAGRPELFNDLGYCLYLQGKLKKAESALLKAVSLSPSSSRYRNNLGLILGHMDRYEEALEQFRHGGSEADAYYNLAFVRASHEEVEEAKECFRLALAVDPSHESAREALSSFEQYDNDPDALKNIDLVASDGAASVAYYEREAAESSETSEPASQDVAVSADDTGPSTRARNQSLLRRTRTLMSLRTNEQRNTHRP